MIGIGQLHGAPTVDVRAARSARPGLRAALVRSGLTRVVVTEEGGGGGIFPLDVGGTDGAEKHFSRAGFFIS